MSFVPIVIPPNPTPPTAEAQELGGRLIEVIRGYQFDHPQADAADVDRALLIARTSLGNPSAHKRRRVLLLGTALGLLAFGGIAAYSLAGGGLPASEIPWILVAVGGLAVVLAIVAALSRA